MEKYIWALDISTTNIGCSLFNLNDGKLIEMKHLELKTDKKISIEDRDIYKAEIFRKYVEEYKIHILNELNGEILHIIVEEPLFGSNNANTVSLLYGFNATCRYIMYRIFNVYPQKLSIHKIRSIFCNEFVNVNYVKGVKKETLSFPKGWKSFEKKNYIWEKVKKLEPQINWYYKKNSQEPSDLNHDMSDSYAAGYAFLFESGIIKNNII